MPKPGITLAVLMLGLAAAQAQGGLPDAAPPPPQGAQEGAAAPVDPLPPPAACTFDKVFACTPDGGCAPAKELGTIDLPARFLVHFERQIIASVSDEGLPHISAIQSAASSGDNITLQGTDGLVGWVMQLSRSEPGVSLTTVTHEEVLTAFGSCKPAP